MPHAYFNDPFKSDLLPGSKYTSCTVREQSRTLHYLNLITSCTITEGKKYTLNSVIPALSSPSSTLGDYEGFLLPEHHKRRG